jgi:hypothetical protein
LSETLLSVRALESVPAETDYVDPAALDRVIETYDKVAYCHAVVAVAVLVCRHCDNEPTSAFAASARAS